MSLAIQSSGGPSRRRFGTQGRWFVISRFPIGEAHRMVLPDGVTDEAVNAKGEVPTHTIDANGFVTDDAQISPDGYTCRVIIGSPLEADVNSRPTLDNATFSSAYTTSPVTVSPPLPAVGLDRAANVLAALKAILGARVDVYSPTLGLLKDWRLVQVSATPGGNSTKTEFRLSFTQNRTGTTERVLVPTIPRAAAQKPTEKGAEKPWFMEMFGLGTSRGSNMFWSNQPSVPENPNSPTQGTVGLYKLADTIKSFSGALWQTVPGTPDPE